MVPPIRSASREEALEALKHRNAKLYDNIKDYFVLIQIQNGVKELAESITVENALTICCALGFFPTEKGKTLQ